MELGGNINRSKGTDKWTDMQHLMRGILVKTYSLEAVGIIGKRGERVVEEKQ